MGCTGSKIRNEDAVWQCGQRKSFVKQAVGARIALATSHARYLQALSSTSVALKSFAESGEPQSQEEETLSSSASVAPSSSAASIESLELPEEIPEEIPARKTSAMRLWNTPTEPITVILSPPRRSPPEEHFIGGGGGGVGDSSPPPPPPPPPPVSEWEYFDIFHPPPAVRRFQEIPEPEEDIPALELSDEEVIRASVSRAKAAKNKGVVIEELVEEEENRSEASSSGASNSGESDAPPPPPAPAAAGVAGDGVASTSSAASSSSSDENAGAGADAKQPEPPAGIELGEVLRKLEDQFLLASEAGKAVSTTLEVRKIHKQLERGFSDHSSRLLSALSLGHWSPRELNSPRGGLESEESGGTSGSHAATLDRLRAWEKKLYEEVKAWENINSELARKRKLLRNLDAKGAKPDVIDKTRASMKALETEISVAVSAMEASSAEIQRISDDEVLPQLLELLKDLAEMWEKMHKCHQEQLRVVMQLKLPENQTGASPQRNATVQLEAALNSWQTSLSGFIQAQKDYVRNLGSWIKSSIHSEQQSRRNKKPVPKIQHLCDKWAESLEKLSSGDLTSKIKELSDTLRKISGRQAEEMRIQRRAESLSKELNKKIVSINNSSNNNNNNSNSERKFSDHREKQAAIDSLRRKVGEEQQRLNRAVVETRAYSLQGLQMSLPPLFQALESFAGNCSVVHKELFTEVDSYNVVTVS